MDKERIKELSKELLKEMPNNYQDEVIAKIFDDNRFQNAFKRPDFDENGYSKSLPVIWNNYGYGCREDGVLILTLKSANGLSSLYSQYLDVKAIVYDRANKRLLIYEPDVSCQEMALKGGAWIAVTLKPEYEGLITLEECYFELLEKLKQI
jgi:hypothetical protein